MISVAHALQTVLNASQDFGVEEVPFIKSVGRTLKEDIAADRDFPPFNRVAMDGITIDYTLFKNGQRRFKIEGIQAAGSKQITLLDSENCIEVMTGAVLPNEANTVIRYEDVTIKNGIASINVDSINEGQNIHTKGKDGKTGAILIQKNTKISAAEIGVLATVGKSFVKVAKQPKVMIVSTGDELVGVAEIPLEHQIRRSNVFTLVSLLERLNITSETAHITDDKPVRLVIPQFNDGKLLITKIDGGVRPNFQLMYSLGADVFINAFNQRLSLWTLHGLYIPAVCDNGQNFKGEPAFVDLYRKFNIRTARAPLDLAFSGIVLVGFFVEMKIGDYSQNGIDGFSWETPFLGRMNNLLENPDPIVVEDALAVEEMALAADRKVRSKLRSTRLAFIYTRILT